MSDEQYDAALDVLRRLDPKHVGRNLNVLCKANHDIAEDLLSSVDQPLTVRTCGTTGRQFLCCDYNRDGDSYKSPWSGKYEPAVDDAPTISDSLRQLEVAANDAFDTYRELYYEGGHSSVYFWEQDGGFAGVALFKNQLAHSVWDSIHVFEVETRSPRQSVYRITSTIILDITTKLTKPKSSLDLSGNLTRQTERTLAVENDSSHIANLGTLVEEIESKLRNVLNDVYFGKTRDIVGDIRSIESTSEVKSSRKLQSEVASGIGTH